VITAIDTSVLLDVFAADPTFGLASRDEVRRSLAEGGIVACDVVWAEVAAWFPSSDHAQEAMDRLGVGFSALGSAASLAAGGAWRSYRQRGGRRERVVADFLIGAHATVQAERLLTRDRGFYRTYFSDLTVLDPTAL
jgi:predicted nucleic acid-binding protein